MRALRALGRLLVASGRFDEALPHLKKLIAAGGTDPGEHFAQLSRTLANVSDKQGALKLMQQLAADYPKLTPAQLAVAQAAANAGEEAMAMASVRRARELRPESEAAVLMDAQLTQRRSNAEALEVLRKYLDSYPGSREVRLGYARVLVAEKRFGEARVEFQRLVAAFPENTEVIYAVALLSLQLSDHVMAEASLKRLLELDFRDQDLVRIYLGQIAEEQKRLPEALDWYKSVGPGAQYLIARNRYAQIIARQGSLDAAREWLQASDVTDGAQRVQLVLAEAQLLRDAGQIKPAFDLVGEALQRLPDNPELLYDYAMLAERIDRVDLLESSLRRLIALRPDHAHAYNALGYSLADRNQRLPEARELIEKALELAPDDAFIVDSMGWVLFRQGALEDALRYLKRAYAARPDPEIAAHLAEVLWTMGDKAEAERVLKETVDKNPDNETLMKTIKRLKP
jgi:Flp pilus assembly protein TadD